MQIDPLLKIVFASLLSLAFMILGFWLLNRLLKNAPIQRSKHVEKYS
jgi:uncharacterized protein YneF (UPF0154 family)